MDVTSGGISCTGLVLGTTNVAASGDNVNVSSAGVVFASTDNINIAIGSFTGGVAGQVLHVVYDDNNSIANTVTLEHAEATGTQDIYLASGADEAVSKGGGWTLICNGTAWFAAGGPSDATGA